eukprot:5860-Heterococcus_DN1.PRE.4
MPVLLSLVALLQTVKKQLATQLPGVEHRSWVAMVDDNLVAAPVLPTLAYSTSMVVPAASVHRREHSLFRVSEALLAPG